VVLEVLVSSRYLTSEHPTPLRTLHPIQQPRPFFMPLFTQVRGRGSLRSSLRRRV